MNWFEVEDPQKYYNEMQMIKSQLLNKEIPDVYPKEVAGFPSLCQLSKGIYVDRDEFIRISSFALISKSWLKPLAEYIGSGKCLEIMAGRGILSKGLNDYGINIIATDNFSWDWVRDGGEIRTKLEQDELWFDIENIDCVEAVGKYGASIDYLICCWAYMDDSIYKALRKMREVNPKCKLIYIGEGRGGCTADSNFYETANFIEDDESFKCIANKFQHWWGIRDRLRLVN